MQRPNEVIKQTQILLDRIRTTLALLNNAKGGKATHIKQSLSELEKEFNSSMDDDLNTVGAIQAVMKFIKKANNSLDNNKELLEEAYSKIVMLMGVLGIDLSGSTNQGETSLSSLVELLIELRSELRKAKQYELGDKIRDSLLELNIQLEDKPEGTIWKYRS